MIAIVDYGMGNLRSVAKALEHLGARVQVTSEARAIEQAEKVVLPGVGAFDAAMRELEARRLIEPLKIVLASRKPYLGICLGLQLLFDSSEEGQAVGLGILRGTVKRFSSTAAMKVPHMGWNQVTFSLESCPLLKGIPEGSFFYFVHSYYAVPRDVSCVAGETAYGMSFPSMVWRENLFASQFHPEKSQAIGLRLLKNFVEL